MDDQFLKSSFCWLLPYIRSATTDDAPTQGPRLVSLVAAGFLCTQVYNPAHEEVRRVLESVSVTAENPV